MTFKSRFLQLLNLHFSNNFPKYLIGREFSDKEHPHFHIYLEFTDPIYYHPENHKFKHLRENYKTCFVQPKKFVKQIVKNLIEYVLKDKELNDEKTVSTNFKDTEISDRINLNNKKEEKKDLFITFHFTLLGREIFIL
jgi:hypothetical protein